MNPMLVSGVALQNRALRLAAFRPLWASAIGQAAADDIARTLLPIIAVGTLGASPLQLGVLQAVGMSAFLLLALPAGVLVERRRGRTKQLMVTADAARFALVVSIPLASALGILTTWQLLATAALVSTADVLFSTASGVALPRVVAAAELDAAYGALGAAQTATAIVAPGLGALVTRLLSAPFAVGVGALGFLVSAIGLAPLRIPASTHTPAAPRSRGWLRDAAAGLAFCAAHPVLRPTLLVNLLWNASSALVNTVLVVFALRDSGVSSSRFAAIAMVEASAAFVASLLARRLTARLGVGRTKLATAGCQALSLAVYPCIPLLPGGAVWWFLAAGAFSAFVSVLNSLAAAGTIARVTPDRLLGRVMSCSRLAGLGIMPIASVAAGVCAELLGVAAVLWLAVGLLLCSIGVLWTSPVRRWRSFPAELEPAPARVG